MQAHKVFHGLLSTIEEVPVCIALNLFSLRISPRMYAGDYDLNEKTRSWFVALEDLSESHFMQDFGQGLTLNQVSQINKLIL